MAGGKIWKLVRRMQMMAFTVAAVADSVAGSAAAVPARRRAYRVQPLLIGAESRMWVQLLHYGAAHPKEWKKHVGMTKETFDFVVELVRADMAFSTNYNKSSQRFVAERCAIALYRLHTGDSTESVARYCKVGVSTAGAYTDAFCVAMCKHAQDWIQLPGDGELEGIARGFQSMPRSQLPCCVGAIDGTHIPICTSEMSYKNYKGFKSIVAQAIVDDKCFIRNWCCGAPGSWSDLTVLSASSARLWINDLPSKGSTIIEGVSVPYYILGDGIYPVRPSMVVPFDGIGLPAWQEQYNFWQSSSRMVVERTFGILKGRKFSHRRTHCAGYTAPAAIPPPRATVLRPAPVLTRCSALASRTGWRILSRPMHLSPVRKCTEVATACAILHNIVLAHGESVNTAVRLDEGHSAIWEGQDPAGAFRLPTTAAQLAHGKQVRVALAVHLQGVHG